MTARHLNYRPTAGMPADNTVKEAYLAAAKTVEGEYEYGATMKAIRF